MINKPLPFKGLNIRIPIIVPIKRKGFINQGSGLLGCSPKLRGCSAKLWVLCRGDSSLGIYKSLYLLDLYKGDIGVI